MDKQINSRLLCECVAEEALANMPKRRRMRIANVPTETKAFLVAREIIVHEQAARMDARIKELGGFPTLKDLQKQMGAPAKGLANNPYIHDLEVNIEVYSSESNPEIVQTWLEQAMFNTDVFEPEFELVSAKRSEAGTWAYKFTEVSSIK